MFFSMVLEINKSFIQKRLRFYKRFYKKDKKIAQDQNMRFFNMGNHNSIVLVKEATKCCFISDRGIENLILLVMQVSK